MDMLCTCSKYYDYKSLAVDFVNLLLITHIYVLFVLKFFNVQ